MKLSTKEKLPVFRDIRNSIKSKFNGEKLIKLSFSKNESVKTSRECPTDGHFSWETYKYNKAADRLFQKKIVIF